MFVSLLLQIGTIPKVCAIAFLVASVSQQVVELLSVEHLTQEITLMTLWSIARSPLIFGGDMTKLDAFTLNLLTNPDMLAVNQNSTNNRQLWRDKNLVIWTADMPDSADKVVALFNAQSKGDSVDFALADYASPVIAGRGNSQEVTVSVQQGKRLALFVRDGGDGISFDHAAWVDPILHGPQGDLKLIGRRQAYFVISNAFEGFFEFGVGGWAVDFVGLFV